ncbi:hypothetical protein [Staphylococcus delphini]|uniref:hypothetical protein n=1 Tax=Staphylococcus delphini TaxID=53344 RepID=UPI001F5B5D2E|nr:hypothetical protein [Staphylococcus delphini]
MSYKVSYQSIISEVLQEVKQMHPLPQKFEESLMKNIVSGKRIYPGSYNRRFDVSIRDMVDIMDKLNKRDIVKLRFQVRVNDETRDRVYKLKDLPTIYYDEENDQEIKLNSENYVPVYEVAKCQIKN